MISKRAQIIIVVLSLTCLYSCKHDIEDVRGCGEFTTYYDSRAFCSFNVGTYWVYENEITLERDTFTVYDRGFFSNGGTENGYFTKMKRTFENAEFSYYQQDSQNGDFLDNGCQHRRIWMTRKDFQSNGQINNIVESYFYLPLYEQMLFKGFCLDFNYVDNVVHQVKESTALDHQNIKTFMIEGPSFSLNACEGHRYRYQMGQGIGLISWENLDLMDGKWELIEFEVQ